MNTEILLSPALGAAVGLVMGLTGAGGGILSVPLLVFFLHYTVSQAAPISLTAIALAAGVAAVVGLRQGLLRYKAAALMAAAGMVSAPAGLALSRILPNAPLLALFGATLLWVGFRSARPLPPVNRSAAPCQLDDTVGRLVWTLPCARALLLAGLGAGFLSGLLGVGGGFVLVPALQRFTNLSQRAVVATSLGVLALVSSGAVTMSMLSGHWAGWVALPFAAGALAGLLLGKWMEPHLSVGHTRMLFGGIATFAGMSLLVKSLT